MAMLTARCVLLLSAILPGAAIAQDLTSPAGYLTTEGRSWYPMTTVLPTVHQLVQVDTTLIGTPVPGIHMLAWRRDGGHRSLPNAYSQTLDFEVRMAHADWSRVQPRVENTVSTLVVDPFVTVFTRKSVVLPDWRYMPDAVPTPFELQLPLDVTWNYDGQNALLWQLQLGVNAIGSWIPVDSLGSDNWLPPTQIGVGCQVTGTPGPMRVESDLSLGTGTAAMWHLQVLNAPPNAPVFVAVGVSNPDLDIGACTRMHSSHDIVAYRGTSTATGEVWDNFPYFVTHDPSLVGARAFVQAFAPDPAQGPVQIAFSQGLEQVYPARATPLTGFALGRMQDLTNPTAWGWGDVAVMIDGLGVITGIGNR